ncbi:MAG: S1/P1 nuclease [Xanthomonadales bacterium]|nr:S1/P1 nuclease [Xanthomonadales bacterium]
MINCIRIGICRGALALLFSQAALAWGPEGHRAVGALALDHMDDAARVRLEQIMGNNDRENLTAWCNWPDQYRETEEGAWTTPMHYINMVPGASEYDRERDCPDGLCATEAIRRYAAELGDVTRPDRSRKEAFGYLCHFVGDLHQTLHAGFGHDRGGNDFVIQFGGEESNLHEFWDHTLIELHTDSWEELYQFVHQQPFELPSLAWEPAEVSAWTNRSHALAKSCAYPEDPQITDEFADRSWAMIKRQLSLGGVNLARVMNAALGAPPGAADRD